MSASSRRAGNLVLWIGAVLCQAILVSLGWFDWPWPLQILSVAAAGVLVGVAAWKADLIQDAERRRVADAAAAEDQMRRWLDTL